MFNNRDDFYDFKNDEKENIGVPYRLHTILQRKYNPNILAKIVQYRVLISDYKEEIFVGLNYNVYNYDNKIEEEVSLEELKKFFRKTNRIIIMNIDESKLLKLNLPYKKRFM